MFEIEGEVNCPQCDKENSISTIVPEMAWQPGGAYYTEKVNCNYCDEEFEIEGRVESSIELA